MTLTDKQIEEVKSNFNNWQFAVSQINHYMSEAYQEGLHQGYEEEAKNCADHCKQAVEEERKKIRKEVTELYRLHFAHVTREYTTVDQFRDKILKLPALDIINEQK